MITWLVDQKDVDKTFTLAELKEFSKKRSARVIVEKFCMFENGVITWMS